MSTDAFAAVGTPPRQLAAPAPLRSLVRTLASTSLALVGLLGLLVCFRRLTGALVEPLAPTVLIVLGAALAATALVFRSGANRPSGSALASYAVWAAPSLVLLLWMAGVSLSGTSALGLATFFGTLLVEEGWSWGQVRAAGTIPTAPPPPIRDTPPAPSLSVALLEDDSGAASAEDERVTQHVTRRREAEGEVIEGWTRVPFAAAQRHATAHVAICPPLSGVPECFAEQADGPSAHVKVAQVLAYGIRLELKLDEPAPVPATVVVEFSIQEHPQELGE